MLKSVFRQREYKYFLLINFLIAVLFLSALSQGSLLGQVSKANAEQSRKNLADYPTTPEGLVDAFIKAGLGSDTIEVQYKYLPDDEDIKSNRKTRVMDISIPWGPDISKLHIAAGYEITEVKKGKNKATVKVLYRRLAWIWEIPIHIKECKSVYVAKDKEETALPLEAVRSAAHKQKSWIWDKEGCRFLHITNDTQGVTYHLAKPGKFWRIIDTYEPYMSVSSAIKWLQETIEDDPRRTSPSEEQKTEIKEDIETLRKHLKD